MAERDELLESLGKARFFLRHTLRDLSDDQARQRTTASELTLGGLLKHVTLTEGTWARFMQVGPSAMARQDDPDATRAWADAFRMGPDDTVASLLAAYADVAAATDDVLRTCPDLDAAHPLPPAPWFTPGAQWSVRRVALHLVAETAQHAGHADIIRESLDGARSMG